jgi:hypothetical protein
LLCSVSKKEGPHFLDGTTELEQFGAGTMRGCANGEATDQGVAAEGWRTGWAGVHCAPSFGVGRGTQNFGKAQPNEKMGCAV